MSLKARGQDLTLKITIDGQPKKGSWLKVKNFQSTSRTEIKTQGYLGETEDDLDIFHSGFDISFEIDNIDEQSLLYMRTLAQREKDGTAPQRVTILAINNYRENAKIVGENFIDVFLKVDDQNAGSRDANITTKFSGKCKTKALVGA